MSFQHNDIEKFVDILQNNISRMGNNSSQCKNWCITITSALLVLGLKNECNHGIMWLMLLPTLLFWFLDSLYLQIEFAFRRLYSDFITECKKMGDDQAPVTTYQIEIHKSLKQTLKQMFTLSTFPFYGVQIVLFVIVIIFSGRK